MFKFNTSDSKSGLFDDLLTWAVDSLSSISSSFSSLLFSWQHTPGLSLSGCFGLLVTGFFSWKSTTLSYNHTITHSPCSSTAEFIMLSVINFWELKTHHPGPEDFLHLFPLQISFQKVAQLLHTNTLLQQKDTLYSSSCFLLVPRQFWSDHLHRWTRSSSL